LCLGAGLGEEGLHAVLGDEKRARKHRVKITRIDQYV
jgi:hypothetical protein